MVFFFNWTSDVLLNSRVGRRPRRAAAAFDTRTSRCGRIGVARLWCTLNTSPHHPPKCHPLDMNQATSPRTDVPPSAYVTPPCSNTAANDLAFVANIWSCSWFYSNVTKNATSASISELRLCISCRKITHMHMPLQSEWAKMHAFSFHCTPPRQKKNSRNEVITQESFLFASTHCDCFQRAGSNAVTLLAGVTQAFLLFCKEMTRTPPVISSQRVRQIQSLLENNMTKKVIRWIDRKPEQVDKINVNTRRNICQTCKCKFSSQSMKHTQVFFFCPREPQFFVDWTYEEVKRPWLLTAQWYCLAVLESHCESVNIGLVRCSNKIRQHKKPEVIFFACSTCFTKTFVYEPVCCFVRSRVG